MSRYRFWPAIPVEAALHRIMIVGCSGAGKTTLATRISERLGLPLIHLDSYYWSPGWKEPDPADWYRVVESLAAAPAWVMDGNYWMTFGPRMAHADSLVWLDYSRGVCLWRVSIRTLQWLGRCRPELSGCRERLTLSFLRHVWTFRAEYRPRIVAALQRYGPHLNVIMLTNDREADDFLAAVRRSGKCV
jgi:adenylate kinase family enzyme